MAGSRAAAGPRRSTPSDPPHPANPGPTAAEAATVGGSIASSEERGPSYRRALANRRFFLLWLAQLISQSGDFVFSVALIWLVLRITGSAFAVGLMVTGTILPGVLLGPFLGVFVDRWDRRSTLIATNIVEGLIVALLSALVLVGYDSVPVLFGIVVLLGAGGTTVRVATTAYVPSVVPVRDLPPANGLLSLSGSLNQIVGLSLGGVVVALVGVEPPIEYDALTFFAAAVLLYAIPRARVAGAALAGGASRKFWNEFSEGVRFIRSHPFVIDLLIIGIIANFFGNGIFALFAPFAVFVLHGNAATYGLLGAGVAAGSLGGALVIGKIDLHRTAGRYVFTGGVALGIGVLLLGIATGVPVALSLMVFLGVSLAVINLPISVVLQAKIPTEILGRVGATFGALIMATAPAGPIVAGWIAQRWSIALDFELSGAVVLGLILVGAATMASLRSVTY